MEKLNTHMDNFGKIPPQAVDTEMAVLGALMLESEAIHKINRILSEDSFYLEKHQTIFKTVKSLSDKHDPVDLITITRELSKLKQLENIGGPLYLTQLTSKVATAVHIEHHARIIQQLYIQRKLIEISSQTIHEAYDDTADMDDILTSVKQKISNLEDLTLMADTGRLHKDVIMETIKEIEADCKLSKNGFLPGITTGLKTLDKATGGWRPGNLIVIAARPSVGKTSLSLFFARKAAQAGKYVNYYGLEMCSQDLMRIMISSVSSVKRLKLRDGDLDAHDWESIHKSLATFINYPILWTDYAGLNVSQIRSNTIRNCKIGKCDMVIIDYLQILAPSNKVAVREQQISQMSRDLKLLALSVRIPVIVLAQLNRAAANDKPQLHHLRESGSIEQDADLVIFPWKEESKTNLNITIAKNRRGLCGDFEIYTNKEMTQFSDSDFEIPNN